MFLCVWGGGGELVCLVRFAVSLFACNVSSELKGVVSKIMMHWMLFIYLFQQLLLDEGTDTDPG